MGKPKMVIDGSLITRFVQMCRELAEARESLPTLTDAQYASVQDGTAWFEGNTRDGLRYVEFTE